MAVQARLHFLGRETSASRLVIVDALRSRGVEFPDSDNPITGVPAVVFCHEIDGNLYQALTDLNPSGRDRVLAVSLGPSHIPGEKLWLALLDGASDVIVASGALDSMADQVYDRLRRWNEVDQLSASPVLREILVGESAPWLALLRIVVEVARYSAAPVLLTGETGTGKELLARSIHEMDGRRTKGQLVIVDCTTITHELAGSELFGHERGAFTGAASDRDGACALADGGTLFLDEIGELPLPLQAQFLRVLQERKYKKVGGNVWRPTDFRLVSATNRDLAAEVTAGRFRGDLFYRINGCILRAPSLRERRVDIPVLARYFLAKECGSSPPELDATVRDFLTLRDYPGNVRELRQLISRIAHRHVGRGPITVGDVPEFDRPVPAAKPDWRKEPLETVIREALSSGATLKDVTRAAANAAIRIAFDQAGKQQAAKLLGVTNRALQLRNKARRRPLGTAGNGFDPGSSAAG